MQDFWDRTSELELIRSASGKPGFGYVTGRRRVGKTALLSHACRNLNGLYHQAVEGTPRQQIEHLVFELKDRIPLFENVTPETWTEFFHLLSQVSLPPLLVFDEFPYWVEGDSTLPSVMQKWIDHKLAAKKTLLLISGSSQSMLHSYFLSDSVPLFGRATLHLDLKPMGYAWFCKVLGLRRKEAASFARFSLAGGVPHYWKLITKKGPTDIANELYFSPSAILSEEPRHLLHDEGITGNLPKAMLDLVGRGVRKPSEIAGRLGIPQNNLSRPLSALLDAGLLTRDLPFGESIQSSKRTLYTIQDPAVNFYYGTFLVFRHRWPVLSRKERAGVLNLHVSRQWESYCRRVVVGSGRYWEPGLEIDLVAPLRPNKGWLVAECKWASLSKSEEAALLNDLRERFNRSRLSSRLKPVVFRVLSQKNLHEVSVWEWEKETGKAQSFLS